jgi:hypothetical protein
MTSTRNFDMYSENGEYVCLQLETLICTVKMGTMYDFN